MYFSIFQISDNMMFSLEIFETAYCYEEVKCLTVVAENHVNKEFLSVLSKCQDFIEWLQQETNGMQIKEVCINTCICIFIRKDSLESSIYVVCA